MMIIGNICYINNIDDNRMMIVIVVVMVMVIIKMIYSYFNNKTMVLAIMIMV
jgi:hypothetical protein